MNKLKKLSQNALVALAVTFFILLGIVFLQPPTFSFLPERAHTTGDQSTTVFNFIVPDTCSSGAWEFNGMNAFNNAPWLFDCLQEELVFAAPPVTDPPIIV